MIETPEWLPFELDPATGRLTWLRMREADYRAASFLDQRMLPPKSEFRHSDWPALPADARRDADYIFHIGNVGSTLISRLLGELPSVFALREPLLLRTASEGQFETLAALFSRTFRPGQRAMVKATSFTSEIADRLVRPGSRALFLYATPAHYLENILAGENSWQTLQALSTARLGRLQSRCPGLEADLAAMHDGLKSALGWACEMTSLERAASALPPGAVLWLDFDLFLTDPIHHLTAIAAHFGHPVAPDQARAICEGPLMRRYSKALEYEYSPELRREILADARQRHGPAIRAELTRIAASARFVDGRISNPHSTVKNNLQLDDQAAYQASSQLMLQAMLAHEDFRNFAFPVAILPPLMTRYTPNMRYGAHADAAYLQLGAQPLRSDLSCTIFLGDPAAYEGGALTIHLGTRSLSFRGAPGSAIVYPSDRLHEVAPVTKGERFVAITFIQSRIADPLQRETLYELNEVAALEGLKMDKENFARLQLVQANLLRRWGDTP